MKWTDWRNIVGVILLLLGGAALLQSLGLIDGNALLPSLIFAVLFAGGGLAFLSILFRDQRNWWAAIPGIVLVSLGLLIAVSSLAPQFGNQFGGTIFLGGISLAFWVVYFMSPQNWWAIIPAGTMLTLAAVAGVDNSRAMAGQGGGIFFLGLGLTFALVAMLPVRERRMTWPWIPAGILFVMGIALMASNTNLVNYIWPAAMIVGGGYLLYAAIYKKSR